MKIYNYHPEFKHLTSDGFAEPSPLDPPGVWLIPAHATTIEPPQFSDGYIPIFNNETWEVVEDHRGIYYDTSSAFLTTINENPFVIPENYTKDVPPEVTEGKFLVWEDGWKLKDIVVSPPKELTPLEKLQSIGLTVEDLKTLLDLS